MKLFVGRLPREVTRTQLRDCFEEYGEVIEVFMIDSQAVSQVGCAFVRMSSVKEATRAIEELHEQCVIIPSLRELGPMQVAFAKGEALRLGLPEKDETLPSFKEAKQLVAGHKEKQRFFEAVGRQSEVAKRQGEIQKLAASAALLQPSELVQLVKDGQKRGGMLFKDRWRGFCDHSWGPRLYDPARHAPDSLVRFVSSAAFEFGHNEWFREKFKDIPDEALRMLPAMAPPMMPPMFGPPPGGLPPHLRFGMPPPPFAGGWRHPQQRPEEEEEEEDSSGEEEESEEESAEEDSAESSEPPPPPPPPKRRPVRRAQAQAPPRQVVPEVVPDEDPDEDGLDVDVESVPIVPARASPASTPPAEPPPLAETEIRPAAAGAGRAIPEAAVADSPITDLVRLLHDRGIEDFDPAAEEEVHDL